MKATTYRKRGQRHEHRVIAEQALGRPLARGEIVHHVDGDRHNNRPENLRVMTQREHMREHGLAVPGIAPAHKPWTKRRKGEALPLAKLTNAIVADIRASVAAGESQKAVAERHGIGQSYVSQIVLRKRWRHVP